MQQVSGELSQEDAAPPPIAIITDWAPWFAWHPVQLYGSGHFAWMCKIHRRIVRRHGFFIHEYSNTPSDYPMTQ
jgi:hypothetical protein